MELYSIMSGPLLVNTYILHDAASNEAAIIDPGQHNEKLAEFIKHNKFNYKYLFATHGHFDHIVDISSIKELLPEILIAIHHYDEACLYDDEASLFSNFSNKASTPVKADILLKGGEKMFLGKSELKTIHTPGHTLGGICICCENRLFTGDTLFRREIGRTDFPGGSYADIISSIKKLYALEGEYIVYPGHEGETTLNEERKYNPYVKGAK